MDFRAACYCYSQLLQLACYASRALIIFRFSRNFLGATVTCMLSLSSISLIQNRTNDFCASFAYLRAKHCICPRKALHAPMQSFAIANAKLCNRQRKALHLPTQSFASVNANVFGERHDTYIICSRISVCMQQQQPKEKYRFISLPLRMFSLSLHHIGYVIGKTHTIRKSCGMSARILNKKRNPP